MPKDSGAQFTTTILHRATLDQRSFNPAGLTLALGMGLTLEEARAAAEPKPEKMFPQEGDRIQLIKGEWKGQFLRPEMLELNARPVEAFPFDPRTEVLRTKNRLNRMLLVKLDPVEMDEATAEHSAEGVLAYSAICTHRGCAIKTWKAEDSVMRCHADQTEFSALKGGEVVGGPATRSLPLAPLGLDDEGFIVALGNFSDRPGAPRQ
ncbi:MAG: Rieske (2Fe-2S) protein [Pseudomonadota bacterium]